MSTFIFRSLIIAAHAVLAASAAFAQINGEVIAAAKREGSVTLYAAFPSAPLYATITKSFQEKYGIRVDVLQIRASELHERIRAEQAAGRFLGDVLQAADASTQMRIADRHVGKLGTIPNGHNMVPGMEPTEHRIGAFIGAFGIMVNTNLVKAEDEPKSWTDLLDPKWKGKLAWREGSDSGNLLFITNIIMDMGEQKADAYFQKLAQQKIVNFTGSARTLVNNVMSGEYPMALNIFLHHPVISAQKGAPVAALPLQPVPSLNGTVLFVKGAPNPHAAMLLIDYMLSKEGQATLEAADYLPAHPDASTNAILASIIPKKAGLKENFIAPQKLFDLNDKAEDALKKYFKN